MRSLKFILISVYVILVIVIIFTNLKCCKRVEQYEIVNRLVVTDPIEKAETVGDKGNLKVTLLWNFPADLDLHIFEPNGNEIYYENKLDSVTGGFLDVDNREGGYGSAENIFWENPPGGEYIVYVKYYKAFDDIPRQGNCQIVIFKGKESPVTYNIEMLEVGKKIQVARIVM